MRRPLAIAVLLALSALSACAAGDGTPPELLVMAAASLEPVMPGLARSFERATGTSVAVVLGSTGALAAQIENGAPADVFLAADTQTVRRLADAGDLRRETARVYAVGELTLVWREGIEPPGGVDALRESRFETIAIANPEHAPYGHAARDLLRSAGIWDEVEPRIVYAENIAQTYQFVRTGNADAGIVARSVLDAPDPASAAIDRALYSPIPHAAAVVTTSTHPAAADFLDFLLTPDAQSLLAEAGFAAP